MKCKKCNSSDFTYIYDDSGEYYIVCLGCNEILTEDAIDDTEDIGPHNIDA